MIETFSWYKILCLKSTLSRQGMGEHMARELTYTPRERKFVMWSAILGYAFDFYNLIVVAFLLVPIQKSLNVTLTQTGIIVGMTLASSVVGGVLFGWLGDKIGRKN